MISPIESLAFSMHANPGVYAVLAGSGLSRAAKIPTGWEITLDLVRRLAAVRGKHCDPDPEQWYRNALGKEPDYSDLLHAICKTPAERQPLLQSYVEPTDDDRDEGAKQPTTAHRAIAALAAQGFIRVIVTTNFDRLFETAFEAAGVTPVVVSTPDQVRGARPLIHTRCCIVKLHGDYLDSRILNTQDELEAYHEAFDRLLDRIFDEFGLVVCGWSAAWDSALRKALFRAPSQRFTTYWATRDELGDEARRLVQHRRAELVRITDADQFFHTIQQHVESLRDFARPHPLSTDAAIASLKRYLAEPRHRIRLSDLVDHVVESVFAATRDRGSGRGPPHTEPGRHLENDEPHRGGILHTTRTGRNRRPLVRRRPMGTDRPLETSLGTSGCDNLARRPERGRPTHIRRNATPTRILIWRSQGWQTTARRTATGNDHSGRERHT